MYGYRSRYSERPVTSECGRENYSYVNKSNKMSGNNLFKFEHVNIQVNEDLEALLRVYSYARNRHLYRIQNNIVTESKTKLHGKATTGMKTLAHTFILEYSRAFHYEY